MLPFVATSAPPAAPRLSLLLHSSSVYFPSCRFTRRCDPLRCSGKSHGTCLSVYRKQCICSESRAYTTGNSFFSFDMLFSPSMPDRSFPLFFSHTFISMTLAHSFIPTAQCKTRRDEKKTGVEQKQTGDDGKQWTIYIAGDANNSRQFQARLISMANRFIYTSKYYFCFLPIASLVP